jgi:hypothetical protein
MARATPLGLLRERNAPPRTPKLALEFCQMGPELLPARTWPHRGTAVGYSFIPQMRGISRWGRAS